MWVNFHNLFKEFRSWVGYKWQHKKKCSLLSTSRANRIDCIFKTLSKFMVIQVTELIFSTEIQFFKKNQCYNIYNFNFKVVPFLYGVTKKRTLWKVFTYGVSSIPYFPVFRLNTEIYAVNFFLKDFVVDEFGFSLRDAADLLG